MYVGKKRGTTKRAETTERGGNTIFCVGKISGWYMDGSHVHYYDPI